MMPMPKKRLNLTFEIQHIETLLLALKDNIGQEEMPTSFQSETTQ